MKCDWRSHSKLITENQRLRHGSGTATEDVGHFWTHFQDSVSTPERYASSIHKNKTKQ